MKKKILTITFNVAIIALTAFAMSMYANGVGEGNMQVKGWMHLRFFTNLSNYLIAFSAIFVLIETIKELTIKDYKIKKWVCIHKFAGTIAVSITFLTVCLFLGPTMGYNLMFVGPGLYLHLIVPLLAIISLLFVENEQNINKKECMFGWVPFILYAIVYFICYITNTWADFYGFTLGNRYYMIPISFIVMSAFALGMCFLTRYIRERIQVKQNG